MQPSQNHNQRGAPPSQNQSQGGAPPSQYQGARPPVPRSASEIHHVGGLSPAPSGGRRSVSDLTDSRQTPLQLPTEEKLVRISFDVFLIFFILRQNSWFLILFILVKIVKNPALI